MGKYIFNTQETTFATLNGQFCDIIRTITEPEEGFDADVLPMHQVRFDITGQVLDVWPDELTLVEDPKERLEYLRSQIDAEKISYSEIAELQGLAEHIDPSDLQLREWAGLPEFEE